MRQESPNPSQWTDRDDTRHHHGESTNLSLIDRVRKHDADSWRVFIQIYLPLIRFWIHRRGLRGEDVQDVCQDVLTSVCSSLERFSKVKEGHSFRAWLRTITQARVVDFIRKRPEEELPPRGGDDSQNLFERTAAEDVAVFSEDEATDDPEEVRASRAVFENAVEIVRSAVEPHTWQAFWRTTVDEQPSAEIAEELGMSDVSVRKAKSRVIIRLRIELGPLLDDITERARLSLD